MKYDLLMRIFSHLLNLNELFIGNDALHNKEIR